MDAINWVLIFMIIFLVGVLVGCIFTDKTDCKKLEKELYSERKYSSQYQKERDDCLDKYIDEVEKNKLYKLWIYELIRDKRSD